MILSIVTYIVLTALGEHCKCSCLSRRLASESPSVTYVSPYNDEDIMAGQGTLGIEILEDLPQVLEHVAIMVD